METYQSIMLALVVGAVLYIVHYLRGKPDDYCAVWGFFWFISWPFAAINWVLDRYWH